MVVDVGRKERKGRERRRERKKREEWTARSRSFE